MDLAQSERDKRKALKFERDNLFAQYLVALTNNQLAVEIKAIDDEIAKSVEDSSSPLQRTSLSAGKQSGTRAESQTDPG